MSLILLVSYLGNILRLASKLSSFASADLMERSFFLFFWNSVSCLSNDFLRVRNTDTWRTLVPKTLSRMNTLCRIFDFFFSKAKTLFINLFFFYTKPYWKWGILWKGRICFLGSKFFHLSIDPVNKGGYRIFRA